MDDADLDRIAERLAEKLAVRIPREWPRLMDMETAGRYLGRTGDAVRHLVKKGTLPVTKVDGKVQVDRLVLDKIITDSTFWPAA